MKKEIVKEYCSVWSGTAFDPETLFNKDSFAVFLQEMEPRKFNRQLTSNAWRWFAAGWQISKNIKETL